MDRALRFQRPLLPPAEAIEAYLSSSREARWFSNFGPCNELLAARLSEAAGRPCVPVANATLGLVVAIAALRDRAPAGADEMLVPSFAFAASAQAAVWNGLRPVFVDIDFGHWHLDPQALEDALAARSGRVAVVVALSSFGVPPPPDVRRRWEDACRTAGVPLLVDSAAGFGARAADDVPIGAQGDAEVVSFHALKPLSAGEGGAVFCRDAATVAEVTAISNFAFDERHQVTRQFGINAKLSEPAAAIALASFDELSTSLERRRELAQEVLALADDRFQRQEGYELGTCQFVPIAAPDAATRTAIVDEAERRRIGVRTYYDPLHRMPAFTACDRADALTATDELGSRMISLPMALDLDAKELAAVGALLNAGDRSPTRA